MKNPFGRSENNSRRFPEAESPEYPGSRSYLRSKRLKIIVGVFTFIVIIVVISHSVTIIQAGHRGGVLFVGAVEDRVLGEGVHYVIPFAEQVIPLEVRTLKFQTDASAASKDLQEVATVIALNYHIDPSKANVIYQD
jgi:prohibitin 2